MLRSGTDSAAAVRETAESRAPQTVEGVPSKNSSARRTSSSASSATGANIEMQAIQVGFYHVFPYINGEYMQVIQVGLQ
jgi:hypothetical protein